MLFLSPNLVTSQPRSHEQIVLFTMYGGFLGTQNPFSCQAAAALHLAC